MTRKWRVWDACSEFARNLLGVCPEFARNSEFAWKLLGIRSDNGPNQPFAELSSIDFPFFPQLRELISAVEVSEVTLRGRVVPTTENQRELNGKRTADGTRRKLPAGLCSFSLFFNVVLLFFACCSAAFGQNDNRIAEKPMLQCNFCSAAFRKLQRNFRFRLWHVAG